MRRWIFFISISMLAVLGGYVAYVDGQVRQLRTQFPVQLIDAEKNRQIVWKKNRPTNWVRFNQLQRHTVGAFVVSEDWAFFQHRGFDVKQIYHAVREAIVEGRRLRGASTITQQVAKNVYLSHDRSFLRKGKEFFYTLLLEFHFSKQKIFEVYINVAQMGRGIFGIERAASRYFSIPARSLSAKESAFLAMLLPNPKKYSHSYRQKKLTSFARKSIESILHKMKQAHYIDEGTVSQSVRESLFYTWDDLVEQILAN